MSGYAIAGSGSGGPSGYAPLTGAAPATVSVGVASAEAVAANAARKGLVLINLSANTISLGLGNAAVLNQGITILATGGAWTMTPETYTIQAINAIANVAASALAVQEFS